MIIINSKKEIEGMRTVGKLSAEILAELETKIKPGASTLEINDYANELAIKRGATSACFKYKAHPSDSPFPKHICTSVNHVVCHGIPRKDERLKDGDIINCDVTFILNGFFGDTSKTFYVGTPSDEAKKLVETTFKAMEIGINAIKPGACISEIGSAIEDFITPFGYGIVEELTGHGIGRKFHLEPSIFHFKHPKYKLRMKPGMIFTVEPMINQGTKKVKLLSDGWTVVTADGKLSAQFEHTVLVTDDGFEILTKI